MCLVNLSAAAVPLPEGEVLLASDDVSGGTLGADTAVWLTAAASATRRSRGADRRRR